MKLKQIIEAIQEGLTSEMYIEQLILDWISHRPDAMEVILKALDKERKRNKNLLDEMGVRLTFTTLAVMGEEQNKKQVEFQIEENRKFYTENKEYVQTKGVHLWPDLP